MRWVRLGWTQMRSCSCGWECLSEAPVCVCDRVRGMTLSCCERDAGTLGYRLFGEQGRIVRMGRAALMQGVCSCLVWHAHERIGALRLAWFQPAIAHHACVRMSVHTPCCLRPAHAGCVSGVVMRACTLGVGFGSLCISQFHSGFRSPWQSLL